MNNDIRHETKEEIGSSGKKHEAFVDYIIHCCRIDNGLRAALKRADNPATEYQSWGILAGFQVNLEKENQRLPYASIAAAIARAKIDQNGVVKIGQAIARCYEGGNASGQAKIKLRRLLACDSVPEVCRILRALFSLIESRSNIILDYSSLLDDLLQFSLNERQAGIKTAWAQGFYSKPVEGNQDE